MSTLVLFTDVTQYLENVQKGMKLLKVMHAFLLRYKWSFFRYTLLLSAFYLFLAHWHGVYTSNTYITFIPKEIMVYKKEVSPLLHLRIFGLYGNQLSTSPPKR